MFRQPTSTRRCLEIHDKILNLQNYYSRDMLIRPYQPQDKTRIGELISTIQREEFQIPITLADQPDLADIPGFYQKGRGNFWVAETGGNIVGTIALIEIANDNSVIRKMFVDKDYRGAPHFTAKNLLDGLEFWTAQKKFKNIYLGTTSKFLAAHRFYEKNNYQKIGDGDLPADFPRMKVDTVFYKKPV